MSVIRALRFIKATLFDRNNEPGESFPIHLERGTIEADRYRPKGKVYATAIFIPGLAIRGFRDPRIVACCRTLNAAGLEVVTPAIPGIEAVRLDPDVADWVGDIIKSLATDPRLGEPGRIGIFAPSFAAGQSLIAASRHDVRDLVSAICTIGTYRQADELLPFLLFDPHTDHYGRLIALRTCVEMGLQALSPEAAHALDVAIEDAGLERENPLLPMVLKQLEEEERVMLEGMLHDHDYIKSWWDQLAAQCHSRMERLSVSPRCLNLCAPVTMIHGIHDNVIPASASVSLHEELDASGLPVRLHLTELLGHGDINVSLSALIEVPYLIAAFAAYFSDLKAPRPTFVANPMRRLLGIKR